MFFIFDLDGTICFDGRYIDSEIKAALHNLQTQHQVIFASARPIRDLLPLLDDQLKNAILIGGNGAITQVQGKIEIQHRITAADFSQITQWIAELDLDYVVDDAWHYSKRIRQPHHIEQKIDAVKLAKNQPIFAVKQPIKIILLNLTHSNYNYLRPKLAKLSVNLIQHTESNGLYNIDLTATPINKYHTLRTLIGLHPYIAFGNDANDIELLQAADYSVCVGEFPPLQQIANLVLPANPRQIAMKIRELSKQYC
ncbi:HAD-IIB family hydrolase [Rodentibacter caecimuris]|uniref:Hydrolase n=1 Tax=Rodentibacter caecimuris TaxID=1796644 RepID=A0ABX3KYU8_9PAST|nr:hydrolase [Rodentibacter heylii]